MKRTRVESTTLASVGYDAQSLVLELEFTGGAVYRYYLVPPEVYRELMDAPSIGRFFGEHVRDAYAFERIT